MLVWPVALYGCETWVMSKEVIERLEAFEMWVWRMLEKVRWEDKMKNEKYWKLWEKAGELLKPLREGRRIG